MSRKLKWSLAVVGCAGAITVALVIASHSTQDKVLTITFIGFTNVSYADRPFAAFVATNGNSRTLRYATHIERKTGAGWPVYFGPLPHGDSGYHDVPAGQEFRLLEYPPRDNEPWRISIAYSVLDGRWGQCRWRVAQFFYDRNLPTLGRMFHEGGKGYVVVGPELHK